MKTILRYTLLGIAFGFLFPIVSFLIMVYENHLAFSLASLGEIHRLTRLQWIIDTAPFFLGLFAALAGRAQARVESLASELDSRLQERSQLVTHLKSSQAYLEREISRRVNQLRTAAQVASEATQIKDLPTLLDQTVRLISERFGFYHVGVFMNDSASQYAVLRAANSEGGQRMLARRHQLKIGEVGIVGYVAGKGQPRIATDVGMDAVFFNNPDLPETRSEAALPLRMGGKTIGVLDIQTKESAAFDEHDLAILQLIADSLANAIENARLYEEAQMSLQEIRSLHRSYLERGWADALASRGNLSYTYLQRGGLNKPEESAAGTFMRKLQAPIKLRDNPIGTLTLEAPGRAETGEEWSADELALIEAITNQAAMALENARLMDATQRRAEQEKIAAHISSRVWGLPDVESILRTTLQELGDTLQASEGCIELELSV